MKKFKFLSVLLLLVLGLFSIIPNAKALPSSLSNVTANELLNYDGLANLYYKTYSDGVVFCSTFRVQGVGSSCTLSNEQWSEATQAGVAAIVKKYNSSKSKQNYFYSEVAINEFLYYYETNSSVNKLIADARNASGVKPFYDAAVSAYNDYQKEYKISLSENSLTFTKDKDSYISNSVTVTGDNYDIQASGVDGTKIEKSGNSFKVIVPAKNIEDDKTVTINVTVSGKKNIDVAKYYVCGSGNQNLVPNIVDTISKTDSKSISGTIKTEKKITKLKISKQDVTTKKELKGAHLVLKDSKGKVVDEWTSSDTAYYVEGLEAGDYTLEETIAPEGYKLTKEAISFTLKADNTVTEVIMYNAHITKYLVKISKQDITTKAALPGATLIIKDSKGNEIDRWVSTLEDHVIELEKGEYVLTEIQAPNGYDLSYEVIKFTVGEDKEVETKVVMYNSKTPDTAGKNIAYIIATIVITTSSAAFSIYKLKNNA